MDEFSNTAGLVLVGGETRDQGGGVVLSGLAGRVLGCLIEKEFTTPDAYPLTLNSLVNACNQRSNRVPVMAVEAPQVEASLEELRLLQLSALFSGADARVAKFKHTLDRVHPVERAARALLAELLLRGPQTAAGLRANAERMTSQPEADEVETLLGELAERGVIRLLPRQPGKKEPRWALLLCGEPETDGNLPGPTDQPVVMRVALPPEAEGRLAALEAEVVSLRAELDRLRAALGE